MTNLLITRNKNHGVVTLHLGRLDFVSVPPLRLKVLELMQEGERHFVLDLAQTRYVDASGLGLLIFIFNFMTVLDGYVMLLDPTQTVLDLLTKTKLDTVFDISYSATVARKTA